MKHFAAMCKQRATQQIYSDRESVEQLTTEKVYRQYRTTIYVKMRMVNSGKSVKFHINTRSYVNFIPRALVLKCTEVMLKDTTLKWTWTGDTIKSVGVAKVIMSNISNEKECNQECNIWQQTQKCCLR